ncbi:TetR family transcriptional regulator [Saccharopolyspora antimicrobica]|uniref:TetR family transcriptional regulator n=1 Tax=Saccharopolyspora antimicrobica TaxID=455193 RepID=A0ABX9TDP0_9PSEU|nr:TetR family transcriptional regulator [Saccharopolyspora antimicrobica]RKT85147.1 TetR family transcriptional regulator [Saccharopolyspora antimicrobica]
MTGASGTDGLRARTRRAVRAEIAEVALELFLANGFDDTTVDEIARAAGMTKRSFFRYFPAKEDVVFGGIDAVGEQVVAELRAQPADRSPWECLHAVLRQWAEKIQSSQRELTGLQLIESTQSLRARFHQKREQWRQDVADVLRERSELDAFTADLLTNAATAALDTAARESQRNDANRLAALDRAFDRLRPAFAG